MLLPDFYRHGVKAMKQMTVVTLLLTLLGGGISTVLAVPVSRVNTGTADVVFSQTGEATISVAPVGSLVAGVHDALRVASATATATGGTAAYRWTPTVGEMPGSDPTVRVLVGRNDHFNKLILQTVSDAEVSDRYPDWLVARNGAGTLAINIRTMPGPQTVAADVWTVSLDAAVWSE